MQNLEKDICKHISEFPLIWFHFDFQEMFKNDDNWSSHDI